jgi:tRNA G18 (ribose-2'-O)-methylase SpoU
VICSIASLDDPRLDPYRDLKRTNWTRHSSWFIAEGRWVVRRLLDSGWEMESVLLAENAVESFRGHIRDETPVLVLPAALVSQLVGFPFHAGVMACGRRVRRHSIEEFPSLMELSQATLVACPHTVLPDNLGSIIRISAAFGVAAILVGPQSADPFSRRTIRVSMGNIFNMPIVEPDNLLQELERLRKTQDYKIVAATGATDATPLPQVDPGPRSVIVLGNEAHGIDPAIVDRSDLQVTIPMSGATDSLNVANAAAVLLYQFTRVLPAQRGRPSG